MKPKVLFVHNAKKESKRTCTIYLFALLVAVAVGTAIYSISELEPEAKITTNQGFSLFVMGGLFFTSLYNFFVHLTQRSYCGQKIVKRYKLSSGDVLDISNKIVSSVQALFCCMAGTMICSYSCSRNMMRTNHHISHAYSWFGASYFFYDIWSMYNVHMQTPPGQINTPSTQMHTPVPPPATDNTPKSAIGKFLRYVALNPIIVGHHIFIGTFGFTVIIYLKGNLGDCVFGFVFLMEASTPFVSLRSVLSRFQLKSSKLYMYNGFAMLVVFFLCRVIMFPYVMYLYSSASNLDYLSAIKSLPTGCKISILILMLPQVYWFCLMVKGATKIMNSSIQRTSTTARKKSSAGS